MTREEWLTRASQIIMDQLVGPHGLIGDRPAWSVSCGWPSKRATSNSNRRVGECWDVKACTDGRTYHLFISPFLDEPVQGDGGGVLPTLVHELVHVVAYGDGHKGRFRRVALAVGLTGKMTATYAGTELAERLMALAIELGPYPHAKLLPIARKKGQQCRLVKVEAVKCCGYVARTTRKWLDEVGVPRCSHGSPMEEVP